MRIFGICTSIIIRHGGCHSIYIAECSHKILHRHSIFHARPDYFCPLQKCLPQPMFKIICKCITQRFIPQRGKKISGCRIFLILCAIIVNSKNILAAVTDCLCGHRLCGGQSCTACQIQQTGQHKIPFVFLHLGYLLFRRLLLIIYIFL